MRLSDAMRSYTAEVGSYIAFAAMPDSKPAPLDEPGSRSGEGLESILPHVQRQSQSQIKVPMKKRDDNKTEGPETQPTEE